MKRYLPILNVIAQHFGRNCEVVLHDFNRTESSLVAMAGSVTGRTIGAPITNFVLEIFKKKGNKAEDQIGYLSKTKDGKTLKSSTMFLREEGNIIGVLCINFCIDDFLLTKNLLDIFCRENEIEEEKTDNIKNIEYYANNVEEFVENIIEEVFQKEGPSLTVLEKQERLYLIRRLDEKGVFLVKGAIDLVASRLGASKYTIYNYLDEVRSQDISL